MIDCRVFYAVWAIFQPYNGGEVVTRFPLDARTVTGYCNVVAPSSFRIKPVLASIQKLKMPLSLRLACRLRMHRRTEHLESYTMNTQTCAREPCRTASRSNGSPAKPSDFLNSYRTATAVVMWNRLKWLYMSFIIKMEKWRNNFNKIKTIGWVNKYKQNNRYWLGTKCTSNLLILIPADTLGENNVHISILFHCTINPKSIDSMTDMLVYTT